MAISYNQIPSIGTVKQLEDLLSEPTEIVIETVCKLDGDILFLGVGGKMGPSLSRMAKRASEIAGAKWRIIGVSRFSSGELRRQLETWGVKTIACDLLNAKSLRKLPDAPNVVYMPAMKFGSTGAEAMTWAMNAYLPGPVCEKYRRSRIVAFSTGNVYGLVPKNSGGSVETDPLHPVGEYAMSCLGRERMFEYFSRVNQTTVSIIRLNYATEMRYGVLVDIARKVFAGQTIDVTMGYLNAIWQGDANAMTLAAFGRVSSPPFLVNVAGPELLSVREVAKEFGRLMNKKVKFSGKEAPDALLSNGKKGHQLFGKPRVSADQLIRWIADWVRRGGASLGKPTHFESRDGKY